MAAIEFAGRLLDKATDLPVDATITFGLNAETVASGVAGWPKALRQALSSGAVAPPDARWNWPLKARSIAGDPKLDIGALRVPSNDDFQGLVLLNARDDRAKLPAVRGERIVLIEYVSAAVWNNAALGPPRYTGCGRALFAAAVLYSREIGYGGRVGLYALPEAEGFYRTIRGLIDLGIDDSFERRRYYEMESFDRL